MNISSEEICALNIFQFFRCQGYSLSSLGAKQKWLEWPDPAMDACLKTYSIEPQAFKYSFIYTKINNKENMGSSPISAMFRNVSIRNKPCLQFPIAALWTWLYADKLLICLSSIVVEIVLCGLHYICFWLSYYYYYGKMNSVFNIESIFKIIKEIIL